MTSTSNQLDELATQGVTILHQVFTDKDLAPIIEDIEIWINQRAKTLHERGKIAHLHEGEPFERRYANLFSQSKSMSKGLDVMYMLSPGIFEFLLDNPLLDILEAVLGPDISCNPIQHLRAKPPTKLEGGNEPSFHNVPWHQDAGVMMAEADGSNILTCWIPLVDVTDSMGPMRAIPNCIGKGYLPHIEAAETMIDPPVGEELLTAQSPIKLTCKKGDVVLMNRFTPHSSTPNNSDICRWSLDLRYQTTGHHTGRTAHPAFQVRSAEQEVFETYESWKSRWEDAFKNPRGFSGHRIHQR